jgi:hypothetical protein
MDADTARLVERHLFDQGYLVHVIETPEKVAEAVGTVFAAGLVALLFGRAAEVPVVSKTGVPAEQMVTLDRAQFEDDAALLHALVSILASGAAGNVPLTDGAGI